MEEALSDGVLPISVFPLVRYMRAFDAFAGAAGYNTCCEVVQSGVPSLLVPNDLVADDQTIRAEMAAGQAPVVVSPCETVEECRDAIVRLLEKSAAPAGTPTVALDGARRATAELLALVDPRETV